MDTEESLVLEHKEYIQSIVAARDNVKIRKKSTTYDAEFVILGLEGQECIHYAMPLRVMGYDYSTYKKQYDDNAAKRKKEKGLTEDEYLSGMKKTDKFIPVITIVIYYGEKPWDGAVSLHGMLNIPKAMETFVNDYKIHLVEAGKDRILNTVNVLREMGMETLGLSHCSGDAAEALARDVSGVRVCHLACGDSIFLE